ncbi:MAG TPA: deaminase [Candidatus Saccharimonadales bacterium]|nr:deaminase [Candidatus Saccharimonadales bacterium]
MQTIDFTFDWSELAFASKKPLKVLHAVFVMAPREMTPKRIAQLVKDTVPTANLVIGIAKEPYIDGFDGQPQFKTLKHSQELQELINKVNESPSRHKIYTLHYFQREAKYILEKVKFQKVLLVNGSWERSFHTREEYYCIVNNKLEYSYVSPFLDEAEALEYEQSINKELTKSVWPKDPTGPQTELQMLQMAGQAAKLSFDHSHQTGATLGKRIGKSDKYIFLAHSINKVVPFQTYALLYGAEREKHFSPVNDLNYYDTIHAEVMMVLETQKNRIDLNGTTLFINLLPCPHCARMFTQTDIAEFVYSKDHSDGYAIHMLEKAGKKVRRIVIDA